MNDIISSVIYQINNVTRTNLIASKNWYNSGGMTHIHLTVCDQQFGTIKLSPIHILESKIKDSTAYDIMEILLEYIMDRIFYKIVCDNPVGSPSKIGFPGILNKLYRWSVQYSETGKAARILFTCLLISKEYVAFFAHTKNKGWKSTSSEHPNAKKLIQRFAQSLQEIQVVFRGNDVSPKPLINGAKLTLPETGTREILKNRLIIQTTILSNTKRTIEFSIQYCHSKGTSANKLYTATLSEGENEIELEEVDARGSWWGDKFDAERDLVAHPYNSQMHALLPGPKYQTSRLWIDERGGVYYSDDQEKWTPLNPSFMGIADRFLPPTVLEEWKAYTTITSLA